MVLQGSHHRVVIRHLFVDGADGVLPNNVPPLMLINVELDLCCLFLLVSEFACRASPQISTTQLANHVNRRFVILQTQVIPLHVE